MACRRAVLAVALAATSASVAGCSAAPEVRVSVKLDYQRITLRNGLEVILHRYPRQPSVAVRVRYHVGSKDDPPGKSGLAHFAEHVIFGGRFDTDELYGTLDRVGGREVRAYTNRDHTEYHETVPSDQLDVALWLEAQRMAAVGARNYVDRIGREHGVVPNELRDHYENEPLGNLHRFVDAALFGPDHPYAKPTIGSIAELDAITADDVTRFLETYYVPNDATLILVGDFDAAEATSRIEHYFGAIPPSRSPRPTRTVMPPPQDRERRLKIEAAVDHPVVFASWALPPKMGKEWGVARAAAGFLSGAGLGRGTGEAADVRDARYEFWTAELATQLSVRIDLAKGADPKRALDILDRGLHILTRWGPDAISLGSSQVEYMTHVIESIEPLTQRAHVMLDWNDFLGAPDGAVADIRAVQSPDDKDVRSFFTRQIVPERRVVALVYPTPGAPPAGRLAETP